MGINLYEYLDAKIEFERLARLLEEVETRIQGLGVDYSRVKIKSTPINDKLADNIDELNRLRLEAIDAQTKQIEKMQKVLAFINSVEDATVRDILQRRYIEGENVVDIAKDINYSREHIHRLEKSAKEKVET